MKFFFIVTLFACVFLVAFIRIKIWENFIIKHKEVKDRLLIYTIFRKTPSVIILLIAAGFIVYISVCGYDYFREVYKDLGLDYGIYSNNVISDLASFFKGLLGISDINIPKSLLMMIIAILAITATFLLLIAEGTLYLTVKYPKFESIWQLLSLICSIFFMSHSPFLISYTPLLSAENEAKETTEKWVLDDLSDETQMSILFTDSNYNYVIYPTQAKTCRVQLYKAFPEPQEVKDINIQQISERSGEVNCFDFSDNLKSSICNKLKDHNDTEMKMLGHNYKEIKEVYCGK